MAVTLPPAREPAWCVVGGMVIAAVDLTLVGRRIPSIRMLPQGRQWADHAAYGLSGRVLSVGASARIGVRVGEAPSPARTAAATIAQTNTANSPHERSRGGAAYA